MACNCSAMYRTALRPSASAVGAVIVPPLRELSSKSMRPTGCPSRLMMNPWTTRGSARVRRAMRSNRPRARMVRTAIGQADFRALLDAFNPPNKRSRWELAVADIFISYKSDRRNAARHLARVLGCYGFSAWYDYALLPGDDYEPQLMAQLSASKIVLVLWCELSTGSEWVLKEARVAREQGKYLPAWIQATELPDEFAGADTINLTTWDGAPRSHELDRLLTDVGRRVSCDPVPDFHALRILDEDWRGFGAPALHAFALDKTQKSLAQLSQLSLLFDFSSPPLTMSVAAQVKWDDASKGDPDSMCALSWYFAAASQGFPQDRRKAEVLALKAAIHGYMQGYWILGQLYEEDGTLGGEPRDDAKAVHYYQMAAQGGELAALFRLAEMHLQGRGGLDRSEAEAIRIWQVLARRGIDGAKERLKARGIAW